VSAVENRVKARFPGSELETRFGDFRHSLTHLNCESCCVVLPVPQMPEGRHQHGHTECGDESGDEYAARPKAERQQQAAQQRPGDAADASHAQGPTGAG
jgi:hypothetical protein